MEIPRGLPRAAGNLWDVCGRPASTALGEFRGKPVDSRLYPLGVSLASYFPRD